MPAMLNFNAANVKPAEALDNLPSAWYNARITESEMKPTRDNKGRYLSLVLTVIDGPYANRKIFDRLNLENQNQKAVDIAYETLSAICHATGVIQLQSSQQLHGIPLAVKVGIRQEQGYDPQNEVKGYKRIGEVQVSGATAGSPSTAVPSWAGQQAQAQPPAPAPQQQWQQPAQSWTPPNGQQTQPPAQAPAPAPQQQPTTPAPIQAPAPQQQPPAQAPAPAAMQAQPQNNTPPWAT